MKQLMLEKLKKMEDLDQRKLLKEILNGFFNNLLDYQEQVNQRLEDRVFGEIDDWERCYDLYFTVCSKANLDPLDNFWRPVFPEDAAEKQYNLKEIRENCRKGEPKALFSIFMELDYLGIKQLANNKKTFQGALITDQNRYPIRISLKPDQKYRLQMEHLYQLFQKNALPWKTLNHPYANKFFEVMISECGSFPDEAETITELLLDLEEYEPYKKTDQILLWNVEPLQMATNGFPMPALDRINYEHLLPLKKDGPEHGYLIDEERTYIRYTMRSSDTITIVCPYEKNEPWNLLKIIRSVVPPGNPSAYPAVDNSRITGFISKFSQKQLAVIRSRGEIHRIVNSLAAARHFELKSIVITDHLGDRGVTYDLNYFITDDIRVANQKKFMILSFTIGDGAANFLVYDLLSFLVSEVQMYFPDYACVGELL
jgi:hypothetical protein